MSLIWIRAVFYELSIGLGARARIANAEAPELKVHFACCSGKLMRAEKRCLARAHALAVGATARDEPHGAAPRHHQLALQAAAAMRRAHLRRCKKRDSIHLYERVSRDFQPSRTACARTSRANRWLSGLTYALNPSLAQATTPRRQKPARAEPRTPVLEGVLS